MPKIPVYDRQFDKLPVSLNAPKQSFDTNIAMFGGGDAAAIKNLGGGMADVGTVMLATAKRMQVEEDELAVAKAYDDYHNRVSNFLVGDGSPGSGAYGRLGGSAQGLTKEAKAELEKMQSEVSGKLTPSQQNAFSLKAMSLSRESMVGVARHEAGERRKDLINTHQTLAKKEFDYALLNYTDADKVNSGLTRGEESLRTAAKYSGLSAEQTDELVRVSKSDALKNVALRFVKNGQYDSARTFMVDDRMSGEDRARVQDALRPAEVADKADQLAEMMIAKGFDKQSAQRHLMENVEDLDVRRVAKQTFNALYASRKAEAAAARQEAIYAAMDKVDALDGDLVAQHKFVNSFPEGPVKNAALRRYKEYASFAGIGFRTDPAAYEDLADKITFAGITTPGALKEDPLAAKVSAKDLKRLEGVLGGKQKTTEADLKNAWLAAKGMANDGKTPVTLETDDKRDLFEFKRWAESKVADTNRADDPAYLQKLADIWTLQGEKKGGSWFGYGEDATFGKSLADPNWLPDTDKDTGAAIRAKFDVNPDLRDAWAQKYDGDVDLAVRAYHRRLLESGIDKLQKQ